MTAWGGWFGGPAVGWSGRQVDGRKRLKAWRALGFAAPAPSVQPATSREVARLLFYAGHFKRIHQLFPELELHACSADQVAATLMVHRSDVRPLVLALRGVPRQEHAARRVRRRPTRALRRVVRMVRSAVEDGHPTIDTEELREILAAWLV